MNKTQAMAMIKATLTRSFDRVRFRLFVLNLVNRMDESKAFLRNRQYVKAAFKAQVQRFERLGTYTSPERETVDILIVHLTDASKLERARTAIRNFVADHLRERDEKDAALVAFVSPTEKQWRFSYVKMEYATVEKESGKGSPEQSRRVGVEARLTPARRFSYLVGEGESCHTAQTRFLPLLQDTSTAPSLADIEDAFSVEAVTKEFFAKYAELFGKINAALEQLVSKDKTLRDEFKAKHVSAVDFSKKLMGQIVFLYFLQKKGWLGVRKGEDWGTGPRDFMGQLVDKAMKDRLCLFNDVLEPLFYDTLATDRGHDAWCSRFKCRIPFLNGGLFEPLGDYDWRNVDIRLPNRLFRNDDFVEEGVTPACADTVDRGTGVLDVFDRYNFTVNEAEPLEKEVAIDPEMLGKVFENLIEENRRKGLGAFYTPREIVHYMCQESLINYLDTAVNDTGGTRSVASVPRADIETFVRLGEQISHYEAVEAKYAFKMPKSIEKNAKDLDNALKNITVCDPAVGSGAFPVGMMTEIVRARAALTPYFNDFGERTPYHFKRHAIQSSLYGVDIDMGAVEIAKLRLWLSLVVDEEDVKQVKPLPNLDYKIVAGDSLLGFPFKSQRIHKIEALKLQFFDETDTRKKRELKKVIDAEIDAAFAASKRSYGYDVTFDFELFFSEVFRLPPGCETARQTGARQGFDVVIANPPYVSVEKFARTAQQAEWKRRFKTFASRGDIYCFFYERGLGLLRDNGVLTFISSNKFQRAGYGKGLRRLLASNRIGTLMDFCELPVFAASTDPMIVLVNQGNPLPDHEFPVVVIKDEAEFESLAQSLATRGAIYKPEQLKEDGWTLEGGEGLALLDKIRSAGTPLGKYVNGAFYYGIKTGLNEAFVIDRGTRDRLIREDKKSAELIKPWIRGKDIKRWTYEFHDLYVIIVRYGFNTELKKYPAILRHLTQFEVKLKARGQCKTSRGGGSQGQHHWLELDNNPSKAYLDSFGEQKIVIADIGKFMKAAWSDKGHVIGNTGYILPGADKALLAILLSTAVDWYARMCFQGLGDPFAGGRIRFINRNLITIPIPPASSADKSRLTKLAERAAKLAEADDTSGLQQTEGEIDDIVYRLFNLTPDEIELIENALANTKRGGAGAVEDALKDGEE